MLIGDGTAAPFTDELKIEKRPVKHARIRVDGSFNCCSLYTGKTLLECFSTFGYRNYFSSIHLTVF